MNAIQDEHGVEWYVSAGDPASRLVNRLRKLGFRWVVLPRQTLRSGVISTAVVQCEDELRATRLADCMGVLR